MSSIIRISNPGLQPSRLHLAIQGILLASALTVSAAPHAESINDNASVKRSYHIDSGSLSQALRQFATNSGLLFSAEAKLTDGKTTVGLDGEYTVAEGFKKLLAGTGLTYRYTGDNSVVLKVVESGNDAASTLPAIRVTGKAVYDPDDPYNTDYNRSNASTATKTDTPIMETPMNIQVVPKSLMNDQQDINITDAITKNVSGVQADHGSGDIYEVFLIRGFSTNNIYRNGLLRGFGTYDPANIEQIEVLKGPASMLYGRAQPGGLINYTTKKGWDAPAYSLQQQFGSYDQYRTTADATGPIDKDGKLRYRLNFSYQDIGSFKQFVNNERYFVAPTLTWRPNDRFEANLELEHKHEKKVNDWGIPSIGNRPAPVPLSRSYLDSDKPTENDTTLVAYDWAFKFNDDWALKNRFLWENWDIQYNDIGGTISLQADNRTLDRRLITGHSNQETYSTNLDLSGKFNLLGTNHDVLLGGDYYHNAFNGPNQHFSKMAPIDIFNPVYNIFSQAAIDAIPLDFNFLRKEERFGVYFQDQITLFDKLHILGGGRYDWVNYGTGSSSKSFEIAKANYRDQDDQKFSPRVGVLYQPWQWLSLFSSYTESLGSANSGYSFNGENFKPQSGEQWEAGFKTEFFDKRFSSTVSFYDLTKANTTTNDPDHPGFKITAGKVRSRGIEVDVKGQVTEKLNLVTTYAFTDIRYTVANASLLGQRPINVPEHQATLWSTYQFTERFKAGLGGVLVGKRLGDNNTPVDLPGYVTMDMMAAYTIPVGKTRLTTQVNIHNLLDKGYYTGAGYGRNSINTGNPLSVMGSLRLQF
ncbi:TonB-dependent siderophore receptor [Methylomonas methanica]|uniref:TonB-dependent siderophore receptor n=1 Tax=Methylomonas methanica (strain DSM 25384 / MC09) TaxID=857087 RepID=F9ZZ86_METMM|nr:TonB-dependent receptor [Methylomonas methanica]AEG01112.1 TonB-dependent siderophore receptor [Methylomonas methanica MC09]